MVSGKLKKYIAVFLAILTLDYAVVPTAVFALTSGPTSLEATSFEPVDTTDMVNLATGDFNYNMPLLEVPGPAGGYPLSLSYHSGIMLDQEASWVGLGWNLSPGAITRTVSGFADDHFGAQITDRYHWDGGVTQTIDVGVTLGVAGIAGVSAGLSFGHDTYRGFGVGGFMGGSLGLNPESTSGLQVGINTRLGVSPWGDPYLSAGVGVGIGDASNEGLQLGISAGISTNFNSVSAYSGGGISVGYGKTDGGKSRGNASLLGASISSGANGTSTNVSIGGASSIQNSRQGLISTSGFSVVLPLPFVYLGYSYQRYWIHETDHAFSYGALYFPEPEDNVNFNYFHQKTYDTYSLLDPNAEGGVIDNPDADKVAGGSFPDHDAYSVHAQGIHGQMRPYAYQGYLHRQHRYETKDNGNNLYEVIHLPLGVKEKPVEFRFVGEFSNRFLYDPEDFTINVSGSNNLLSYNFNNDYQAGEPDGIGYDPIKNKLAGSRDIVYFTNNEINDGTAKSQGFIDTNSEGFIRPQNKQIGGFMITNETGVTYHFALPVYSYQEFQRTDNIKDGKSYSQVRKNTPYASAWLLTAVTGPDFVDRELYGFLDEGDWGYWINFHYKLWMNNFQWRNPVQGKKKDLDQNFEFHASGKREVYYLNKIITASHQADFLIAERPDGREVSNLWSGGFMKTPVNQIDPECYDSEYQACLLDCQSDGFQDCASYCHDSASWCGELDYYKPRPLAKLTRINLKNKSGKVLRAISFETDNSLVPNTPNSFNMNSPNVKLGKLTLKAVKFLGKDGLAVMPPTRFEYDPGKNFPYQYDHYDNWGFYKSDFDETLLDENENLARLVTQESSKNVDAWSLTKIYTPIGANIEISHDSDFYQPPTFFVGHPLEIGNIELKNNNTLRLHLKNSSNFINSLVVNDKIDLKVMLVHPKTVVSQRKWFSLNGFILWLDCGEKKGLELDESFLYKDISIFNSGDKYFDIQNQELFNKVSTKKNITHEYDITNEYGLNEFCWDGQNYYIVDRYTNVYEDPIVVNCKVIVKDKVISGGGLKTNKITLNNLNSKKETRYTYYNGVTAYEPNKIDKLNYNWSNLPFIISDEAKGEIEKDFLKKFLNNFLDEFSEIIYNSRELPPPGVIYKRVRVEEYVTKNGITTKVPGYSDYEFQTFEKWMVEMEDFRAPWNHSGTINSSNIFPGGAPVSGLEVNSAKKRNIAIRNRTASLGSLKSITLYSNGGLRLSKTINHYLHDGDPGNSGEDYSDKLKQVVNGQGIVQESFADARIYRKVKGKKFFELISVVSTREELPSVITGQTNINYRNNTKTISENLAYDFFTGQVIKSLHTDSYGNKFLTEITPAYRKYNDMGLALHGGKNMLTQSSDNSSFLAINPSEPIETHLLRPDINNPNILHLLGNEHLAEMGDIIHFKISTNTGNINYEAKIVRETQAPETGDRRIDPTGGKYFLVDYIGDVPIEFNSNPLTGTVLGYIIKQDYEKVKLIQASVQTWTNQQRIINNNQIATNQTGIWRQSTAYFWKGDDFDPDLGGLYPVENFSPFDFHNLENNSDQWQRSSQVTLYDYYSHALEAKDINDNYAATKMDNRFEKVLASGVNTTYGEFGYSGAEEPLLNNTFGGRVSAHNGIRDAHLAHTGTYSLRIPPGGKGFSFAAQNTAPKTYKLSFWVHKDGKDHVKAYYSFGPGFGPIPEEQDLAFELREDRKSGDWYLISIPIEVDNPSGGVYYMVAGVRNGGTGNIYVDDFRVEPYDASVNAFVYNEYGELTHILDNNNLYTEYEYDPMGRLKAVHRETFKHGRVTTNEFEINYANKDQ